MKKILILNGSPRKNGSTESLVKAFTAGAEAVGNKVRELYLQGMNVNGCLGCDACSRNGGNCVQQDDMGQVIDAIEWSEVVVFASPMFWGTVSGQLKVVVDRLYAECNKFGFDSFGFKKETAFLMTARGGYYQQALDFYSIFTDIMGWKNWGTVLGAGKETDALELGGKIR